MSWLKTWAFSLTSIMRSVSSAKNSSTNKLSWTIERSSWRSPTLCIRPRLGTWNAKSVINSSALSSKPRIWSKSKWRSVITFEIRRLARTRIRRRCRRSKMQKLRSRWPCPSLQSRSTVLCSSTQTYQRSDHLPMVYTRWLTLILVPSQGSP